MTTPDFILRLREKIGHDELWLSGVTAVVLRGEGAEREVLLVERADNGWWTAVTGIIDPMEQPAAAAEREVLEETGIVAVAESLALVDVHGPVTYDNGDMSSYLDLVFRCRYVSGDPYPADGENTAAKWVRLAELPALNGSHTQRIRAAAAGDASARFTR